MSSTMGPTASTGLGKMEEAVEEHCEGGRGESERAVGLCVVWPSISASELTFVKLDGTAGTSDGRGFLLLL